MKHVDVLINRKDRKLLFDDSVNVEVAIPNVLPFVEDDFAEIERAIKKPIGCSRLSLTAKPGQSVAIIVTDITRKIPDGKIVKVLLDELTEAGVKEEDVKVVIATGLHRPNTPEEIIEMLGEEVPRRVRVINHMAKDDSQVVFLGHTQHNLPVVINRHVVESDIRIATGTIEPHKLAGYSGGVKTMSVGTAGEKTIAGTHNLKVEEDPSTRIGVIHGNLFREYLTEIAAFVRLDFIVNVIQNKEGKLVRAVAGHPRTAFEDGVKTARLQSEVKIARKADLVVAIPPYPKSRDVYQASRAMNSVIFGAEPVVRHGGSIIVPAECQDGWGHPDVYNFLAAAKDPKELIERIWKDGMPVGGAPVAFKLANIMQIAEIFYTDCRVPSEMFERMHMRCAETAQDAIDTVMREKRIKDVLVMPYATGTLPVIEGGEGSKGR